MAQAVFQRAVMVACAVLALAPALAGESAASAPRPASPPRPGAAGPAGTVDPAIRLQTSARRLFALETQAARAAYGPGAFDGERVNDPALALARLAVEQAAICLRDGRRAALAGFNAHIAEAERAFEARAAGFDPMLHHSAADARNGVRRVGALEGAYISPIDASAQPYRYFIPERWLRGDEPAPLVVLLHGYVPYYDKADWLGFDPALLRALDGLGVFLLQPFGRGNTDFLTIGEVDVLAAVEEMRRRYPIDDRRIYLAGFSMGGSGAWTLLAHYPDRWAGARIWSGRNDWFHWHEDKLKSLDLDRDSFPAYKLPLVLADNPYDLFETLLEIPVFADHPLDDDLVQPTQSSRMFARLAPPAGRMTLRQPATGGHFRNFIEWADPEIWRDLLARASPDDPDRVEHVAFTPKYGAKHWLAVTETLRPDRRARLAVRRDAAAKTYIVEACENIARFRILPGRRPWAPAPTPPNAEADWRVVLADGLAGSLDVHPTSPDDRFGALEIGFAGAASGENGGAAAAPAIKRARGESATLGLVGLFGPLKEAFNEPFAAVIGVNEKGEPLDPAAAENLSRFYRDWGAFAHAEAPVVGDIRLLEGLAREKSPAAEATWRRHYVLFGSPANNRYLARLAPRLPFRFDDLGGGERGFAVAGPDGGGFEPLQAAEAGGRPGLAGIYPNPDIPDRYIAVIDGTYYGEKQSFNHKWDLAPDFILFGPDIDPADGNNRALRAGFFDNAWRAAPALTWPEVRH